MLMAPTDALLRAAFFADVTEACYGTKEAHTEQGEKSPLFNFAAADFAVTTKRQIDAITKAQSEALDNFQEINQQWLDRIQAEAA